MGEKCEAGGVTGSVVRRKDADQERGEERQAGAARGRGEKAESISHRHGGGIQGAPGYATLLAHENRELCVEQADDLVVVPHIWEQRAHAFRRSERHGRRRKRDPR